MDNYSEIRVPIDKKNPSIKRHNNKCVLCGKCKDICQKQIGVAGYWKYDSEDIVCINCGQCANVCPVDAITEQDDTNALMEAINSNKKVVIITSPSVRVALGETAGYPAGEFVQGKMVSALKQLGADYVFDVTFGADLTIMEEASELIDRIKNNKTLPQFTSCCPAWVKFVETFYPKYIPNLSTTKSPISMQASIIRNYFAPNNKIDPNDLYVVAVTPCVAKKYEVKRPELSGAYGQDTDLVITTRELGKLLKRQKINLKKLNDEQFDLAFPAGTGAGMIFGASGGVMEAAVRTAYYLTTGNNPTDNLLNFTPVRGLKDVKTAKVKLLDTDINLCVIYGTANARKVLDKLKTKNYHFIEVMTCPNGCVGGGGQPKQKDNLMAVEARANGLYKQDENMGLKASFQNAAVQNVYKQFLGAPGSEKAKEYLHTTFTARK